MRAAWQEWGSITEVVNLRRATDRNAMNEIGVEKGKRLVTVMMSTTSERQCFLAQRERGCFLRPNQDEL
jgi:hypothetical protein